uniref:Iron outer membrane receptor n=1 Tax=Klebsiella pneumoniae subsp. pneumoniae TaxID=72407 RepID=A0A1D9NAW8_KLEPN|nr:iron outer membrane receptor [Klebsiella pneumoniae subsp. pneumoniae]
MRTLFIRTAFTISAPKGDMRRNERNLMWNLDPYIQTHWQLTSALGLDAGRA